MLFKVLRGSHYQGKKIYKKGETVESFRDLVAVFGKKKFERDYPAEQRTVSVARAKPNIPLPVDDVEEEVEEIEDDDKVEEPLSIHGENVTSEFPTAEKVDMIIFVKANWYSVIDKRDNKVLNKKKLRRKEVEPFLEQYATPEG